MLTGFISSIGSIGTTGAGKILGIVGGAAAAIAWFANLFVKTINEGERGIRQRNGKPIVYKRTKWLRKGWRLHREGRWWRRERAKLVQAGDVRVEDPGTHTSVPIFFSIRVIDTKIAPKDLPQKVIIDANGTQRGFSPSIEWSRGTTGAQLRKSELGVAEELEMATNRVGEALQYIVETYPKDKPFPTSKEIASLVHEECRGSILEDCGIHIHRVLLTGICLAPEQKMYDGMKLMADAVRERSLMGDDSIIMPMPLTTH